MADITTINSRIDYLISQFNFFAGTRYKKSTETLRQKLTVIASSDCYDRVEASKFFKEQATAGHTDIYSVIEDYAGQLAEKEEAARKEKKAAFTELTALDFLGGVVTKMLSEMKLDEIKANVGESLKDEVRKFIVDTYGPIERKIVIELGERKTELDGVQHKMFDTVLKFVQSNEPVFLTGPAGSGKNVLCKQVAKVLGLPFYFTNAVTQEYKLTGFTDANGVYQESQFYKAFKNGGLFMLDEMDASIPEVLIILNAAIANRYFDFPAPIGYVEANPNFRVIAAGNTFGYGADSAYVGRNQLDEASLDRFAMVRIDYDSRIEEACANGDRELLGFARAFRKATSEAGIQKVVSYRAISRMAKLTSCMKAEEILETCLIKAMEVDDLKMIEDKVQGYGKYTDAFMAIRKKMERG